MDFGIQRVPRKKNHRDTPHRKPPGQKPRGNADGRPKSRRGKAEAKSLYGHTIVHAPTNAGYGLEDDIYSSNSPVREGRPRLSSSSEKDESEASRFSDVDSVEGDFGDSRKKGRSRRPKQQQTIEQRRQREKDKLADCQRQEAEAQCIYVDDEDGVSHPQARTSCFDGVPDSRGGDYDPGVAESVKSRPRSNKFRGNTHAGSSLYESKRILRRDRERGRREEKDHGGYSHLGRSGRVLASEGPGDPLDQARSLQDTNRSQRSNRRRDGVEYVMDDAGQAAEKRRSKGGSITQTMSSNMDALVSMNNGGDINPRRRKKKECADVAQQRAAAAREKEKPSSGEKRKAAHKGRDDGVWSKKRGDREGSRNSAIDLESPDEAGLDIMGAVAASEQRLDPEVFERRSASRDETGVDDAETMAAMLNKKTSRRSPPQGAKKKGSERDFNERMKKSKKADGIVESWTKPNNGWLSKNSASNPPTAPTKKGRANVTYGKIAKAGGLIDNQAEIDNQADNAWGYDGRSSPPSSGGRKGNRRKKRDKRQSKLSVVPKRQTRSSSRPRKIDNEVITIDSSSDDESSVEASFDASGSNVEISPKRTRSSGDRASIDAVRIAVGKKLFKKGCELSLQLGTRNPYILFSFLDGKGKKKEHSVHLIDDELKELRYYIEDDTDEANDIDDAMSVIAFRITPSEKNDFVRYPNVYDPDEFGGAKKIEKRYIVVELRDSDELQAMLAQMQEHPNLELWCGAESKIPAKDLGNYTKAFVEDNRKEKQNRLSVAKRTRSGGAKEGKKASENKLLLVYPFAVDESVLTAAADGLRELGGDLLGVEGASQSSATGSAVEAEATDQSDGAGDTGESKGKSSRTHYITIREDDKDRLSPGQFLNDSLVDFWMRWISRGEPSQPDSNVHFFTSHFMTTLKDDGPEAVASWTEKKNINVFSKKLIFVPVNADLHWSLCVVVNPGLVANNFDEDISEDEEHAFLFFLDSLKMHSKKTYSKHIRKWLNCEWKRLKNKKVAGTLAPFAEGLEQGLVPMRSPKIPYQENGCDCGVFVCRYAYALYTMRHQAFTWAAVTEKPAFKTLISNGPAFQFGMSDIARIRVEMGQLIDNLSKHYLAMKEVEKDKKRAAKKAAKQGDSTETGDANTAGDSSGNEKASDAEMADASPGNEEAGDVAMADTSGKDGSPSASSEDSSDATGENVETPEGAEEAAVPKEGDEDAVMTSASSEKEETGDIDMEDTNTSPEGASPSLRSSLESSVELEASDADRSEKKGDGDVAMSLSDEKENIENDSEDAGTQSGLVDGDAELGNTEDSDGVEQVVTSHKL